jgi:hypothetical protein
MTIETLAARLDKLELSSRRWKWAAGALSLFIIAMVSISATTQQALPAKLDSLSVDTLTVHKLNVTDGEKSAGIVLWVDQKRANIFMTVLSKVSDTQTAIGGNCILYAGEDESGIRCTLPSERIVVTAENPAKMVEGTEGFMVKNTRTVSSLNMVRENQAQLGFITQPGHGANLIMLDADKNVKLKVP